MNRNKKTSILHHRKVFRLYSRNAGFTLVEMAVVLLFLGIMAFVAVPRLQFATLHRQQADTVAKGIVTDLRLTRALAISESATNVAGFGLDMNGSEPYTGYDMVNLDTSEVVESYTIDPVIQCTGGSTFNFGPLGNLLAGSDTQIVVSSEGRSFTITVISATGAVLFVEN